MVEAVLGFIVGVTINWWAFGILFCLAMWCEHGGERFWASVWAIVLGIIAFFLLDLTWSTAWPYVVGYIPVGFMWSFWRWRRHTSSVAAEFEASKASLKQTAEENERHQGNNFDRGWYSKQIERAQEVALDKLSAKDHADRIVYWVLMWPFSFLEQFVGDIIDAIEKTVRLIADATYNKISASAAAKIKTDE